MIKRFKPSKDFESLKSAAEVFVKKLNNPNIGYLYYKPYDLTPGNKTYFRDMYDILNIIEVMHIKPYGRLLEIGSGSGWVTEILAALGFKVVALEPCNDFIKIARKKLKSFSVHLDCDIQHNVEFCNKTLEESNFESGSFDAILFFASLHHMIDEETCIRNCYKYLKSGGILGVGQEECYNPSAPWQMALYEQETKKTGVLESPFTKQYLDYLLEENGFVNIKRYYKVNGLFSDFTMKEVALPDSHNTITAKKPYKCKTTLDTDGVTKAKINIIDNQIIDNTVKITVSIINCGETVWLHDSTLKSGFITLALYKGEIGNANFKESLNRVPIPYDINPGEEIVMTELFIMPDNCDNIKLDLINEGLFWFSQRQ